jgi:hypothetical protein
MDGIPDLIPINELSDKRLRELHLYKELMTAEERGDRYRLLRLSGASVGQAQRWRDWSPPHYQSMLDYILKTI